MKVTRKGRRGMVRIHKYSGAGCARSRTDVCVVVSCDAVISDANAAKLAFNGGTNAA